MTVNSEELKTGDKVQFLGGEESPLEVGEVYEVVNKNGLIYVYNDEGIPWLIYRDNEHLFEMVYDEDEACEFCGGELPLEKAGKYEALVCYDCATEKEADSAELYNEILSILATLTSRVVRQHRRLKAVEIQTRMNAADIETFAEELTEHLRNDD